MTPSGQAAEPQPAPQPQVGPGPGLGRQCECPMLRSMPLTVANFLLLRPGAHSDYYPIYMQRQRLFSAASWIFFLNTSSFCFVLRHLAAILCQFPVHCVWVSLAPAQTHKQNQIQADGTETEAGKQQPEWSFASVSLTLQLSPFGWVPSVVQ